MVTVSSEDELYRNGRDAIRQLEAGEGVEGPPRIVFADEAQLAAVFNERTYRLLRTIRERAPGSIRETARLVGRDVKNVHDELTTLEGLGVIRFEDAGRAKRPVFPYDDLVINPLGADSLDSATVPR